MTISTVSSADETQRIKDLHESSSLSTTKDMFQELFLAQLNNQDPMNPMDNNEFLAQMAQFNSLELLTSMNENIEKLATTSETSLGAASNLIGKYVKGVSGDSLSTVEGIVSSIKKENDNIILDTGYGTLNMDEVISVTGVLYDQIS